MRETIQLENYLRSDREGAAQPWAGPERGAPQPRAGSGKAHGTPAPHGKKPTGVHSQHGVTTAWSKEGAVGLKSLSH